VVCDAQFMPDVYHRLTDPAAISTSIAAALKPGGGVAIVDFTPPGDEAACPADRASSRSLKLTRLRPEAIIRDWCA
jgi:hypothetical protein